MPFLRMLLGAVLGALVGGPLGGLLHLLAYFTVLPRRLADSEPFMLGFIAVAMAASAVVGAVMAGRSGLGARRVMRGAAGFAAGTLLGAIGAVTAAVLIGGLLGVSDFEGAYSMGVVFGFAPLGGLVGGVVGAALGALSAKPKPA